MNELRILVVDDEQKIRLLLKRYLGNKYSVLEATDGREAVDMARKYKPNLILMDILMPYMGGYEACSMIKNDTAMEGIPVIMLTALGYDLNRKLAAEIAADGYITKPITSEELLATIDRFLNNSR